MPPAEPQLDDDVGRKLAARMQRAAGVLGIAALLFAVSTLLGWAFKFLSLATVFPGSVSMKVNTAIAVAMLSSALFLRSLPRTRIGDGAAVVLCALTAAIAAAVLVQFAFGVDLHIDELLARDPDRSAPGRMSIATACIVIPLATGIALANLASRLSQGLAAGTFLFSLVAVLSYFYASDSVRSALAFYPVAFATATSLTFLSLGTILLSPARDHRQLLGSPGVGGTMARRLLPAVMLVPPVVGWIHLRGHKAGIYGIELGLALFATACVLIFGALVYWNASLLDQADALRRRLERERESLLALERAARERAEEASKAKDKLLSVVSHELRTPLTPVMLLVRAIEADPTLPSELRGDFAVIREQVSVEVKLINDLLDMASISDANVPLNRHPTDLSSVVTSICAAAGPTAREAGISLDVDSPRGGWVSADEVRLGQILRNIVDNAIKFSPRGSRVRAALWFDDREATVEVVDQGIGMTADQIAAAFDPFVQADSSITRKFGGMGIGLTVARRFTLAHGGNLVAISPGPSLGSTFRLTLPRIPPPAPTAAPMAVGVLPRPAMRPASAGAARVLLVEDNAMTLRTLGRLLTHAGFDVTLAASATEAIAAVRSKTFDVVVSDIGLPETDGWQLFSKLREIQPVRGIALSGFVTEEDREKSARAGFEAHLDKPVEIETLLSRLRTSA